MLYSSKRAVASTVVEASTMETTPLLGVGAYPSKTQEPCSWRSSEAFLVFTVAAAIFTDTLLYAIIVPILPYALVERMDIAEEDVQWWESMLFATFGVAGLVSSPLCGYLADRWRDRRTPFLCGLLLAMGGTFLFGFARTPGMLILSRICQGLASTVVFTVGLALIGDVVPSSRIGEAIGYALSGVSAGFLVAPTLAGYIYDRFGYEAVFWVCVALLAFDVLLRTLLLEPKTTSVNVDDVDAQQQSHNNYNNNTIPHDTIRPVHAVSDDTLSMAGSEATETMARWKMPITLRFLANPPFLAAFVGYSIYTSNMSALDGVLALFVKREFHWSSTAAGLSYLTVAIPALGAPLVGRLSDRFGAKRFIIVGFLFLSLLQLLLRFAQAGRAALLCTLLFTIGQLLMPLF
jgi:MFS family permease